MVDLEGVKAGLDNGEFFLEYLPTVSLRDNRCVGCESLVRWRHNGHVIPPLEFIPLIDNTLLSGTMTYWVIERVADELGAWLHEHEDVHIGINVAPGMLGHAGVMSAIGNSRLLDVIDQLVVEITERSVPEKLNADSLSDGPNARARVAMDDTALTDASLVTLSRANIDIVKIDKPFIDQILRDDCPKGKMNVLSTLLRDAKYVLIAEGVESSAQADALRGVGVHMAQGWFFSRPLAAADFKKYFTAHQ